MAFKRPIFYILFFICAQLSFSKTVLQANLNSSDSAVYYIQKAKIFCYKEPVLANSYLEKAREFFSAKDSLIQADWDYRKASLLYIKGDYKNSIQKYKSALRYYKNNNLAFKASWGYNGIGLIQQAIGQQKEAILNFKKSLKIAPKEDLVGSFHLNTAISLIKLKQYDSVETYLDKALLLGRKANRGEVIHMSLNRKAQAAFLQGDIEKSILLYESVLNNSLEPSNWEKSFAYAGLAEDYLALGDLAKAEDNAIIAYQNALQSNGNWDLQRNTKILADIYEAKGDYQQANKFLNSSYRYKDSLVQNDFIRKFNLMELEQKEIENQQLLTEKEIDERRLLFNSYIIGFIIVVVIVLGAFLIHYKKTDKQKAILNEKLETSNQLLERLNEDKIKLFSILSHDLRSPLASMSQLLDLLRQDLFTVEEKEEVLKQMSLQLSSTSLLLQNLLSWSKSQLQGVNISLEKVNIVSVVDNLLKVFQIPAQQKSIKIIHELPERDSLVKADKAYLELILRNLISNALKYTFEGGEIKIFYTFSEKCCVHVYNQGVPISDKKIKEILESDFQIISEEGTKSELGTGLGLALVKYSVKVNQGSLKIQRKKDGSDFVICLNQ